jgi:hypothetical protein
MRRHAGRVLICILFVTALTAIPATASSRARTSDHRRSVSFTISSKKIAGLLIAPDTPYRRIHRYFSSHEELAISTRSNGFCYLSFPNIRASITLAPVWPDAAKRSTCMFFNAAVRGPKWHTTNGLHVGGTTTSMHRLFPGARRVGRVGGIHRGIPAGTTAWWLANWRSSSEEARPVLTAFVRRARVVALGITVVGH